MWAVCWCHIYGLCCHCATVLVTTPRAQVLYSWWPLLYMVWTALFDIIFLLLDNTIVLLALSYIFWETSVGQMVQSVDTEHSLSSWVRRSATFVNPIHYGPSRLQRCSALFVAAWFSLCHAFLTLSMSDRKGKQTARCVIFNICFS